MTDNLTNALHILKTNDSKLVMTDGKTLYSSSVRGVYSLLDLIDKNEYNLSNFSAADKVVGRGAALLYAKMRIKEVYGIVMSEKAKEIFDFYSIPCFYNTLVPFIINRQGDGTCPVEKATENMIDCEKAYSVIQNTVNYKKTEGVSVSVPILKKQTKEIKK